MSEIIVLGGMHGGGEEGEMLGVETVYGLMAEQTGMAEAWIAHPEAVAAGKRHLGETQLMQHFPGDTQGNQEDRAAAVVMDRLGNRADNPTVVVADIHNSAVPGLTYAAVGQRALPASLTAASRLGYNKVLLEPTSFHRHVPNAISLEQAVLPQDDMEAHVRNLVNGLGEIAAVGVVELTDEYGHSHKDLEFYRQVEIATPTDAVKTLEDYHLTPDVGTINALEAIPVQPVFSPLDLGSDVRKQLGIPNAVNLYMGYWNHNNKSQPVEGAAGLPNDRLRRAYFGSLLIPVEPPLTEGAWLVFPKDS